MLWGAHLRTPELRWRAVQLAGAVTVVAGVICAAWPTKAGGSVFAQVPLSLSLQVFHSIQC